MPSNMKKSAKIGEEAVRHVAKLARLELTDEDVRKFRKDINDIISAFSELDKAKVKNIAPSFQPLPTKDVARDDQSGECLSQEKALENTKHKQDGYFKGPRAV